jgi:hypothetical protein
LDRAHRPIDGVMRGERRLEPATNGFVFGGSQRFRRVPVFPCATRNFDT